MRYFIELSYRGTAYHGWQIQPNACSVQQTIEEALSKILRCPTEVVGCGRTDTGVHASFYVAHFESDNSRVEDKDFVYHLNCILPYDIAIHKIYPTELHARFDARYREYKYYVSLAKDPFAGEHSWLISAPLDFAKMQRATQIIEGYTDFASMSRVGSDNKTTICEIFCAHWETTEKRATFTIGANRFLRGMVRAIVGTLVEVGRGKIDPEDIHRIMAEGKRSAASAAAPPQGLFLTDVKY